jgi:hypothetical protein
MGYFISMKNEVFDAEELNRIEPALNHSDEGKARERLESLRLPNGVLPLPLDMIFQVGSFYRSITHNAAE